MSRASRYLDRLEEELLAADVGAMLLEELDGFLTGVVVCPDLIAPSEWLPVVWGPTEDGTAAAFDTVERLRTLVALIIEHHNNLAGRLRERPERYAPIFPIDGRNGDVLWEIWIEGFQKAVELRPAAWHTLLDTDTDAATALSLLSALRGIAQRDGSFTGTQSESDALAAAAPDRIADFVLSVNRWRLEHLRPDASPSPTKIGRNDPCPCGSGRKFKKCCGGG